MTRIVLALGVVIMFMAAPRAMADAAAGEKLFNGDGRCKTCHRTSDKKKVGPGLKGVVERAGEDWLRDWLKDPPAVWNGDNPYTLDLKKKMKKESKPKPTHKTRKLTDQEVGDLIDFFKTL
ncbi:MAG: c-type cytochrome [Candidatus Nitrospinota bacterium M3_3B_026]